MKKIFLLSFALLFGLQMFAQHTVYSNDTFTKENYSISFPTNWTLSDDGIMGTDCVIRTPLTSATDSFSENITVIRSPLRGGEIEHRDEVITATITALKKIYTNFSLQSNERVTINNLDVDILKYSFIQGEMSLILEQHFIIANDQTYVITATTNAKNPEFQKELTKALHSFKLSTK